MRVNWFKRIEQTIAENERRDPSFYKPLIDKPSVEMLLGQVAVLAQMKMQMGAASVNDTRRAYGGSNTRLSPRLRGSNWWADYQ